MKQQNYDNRGSDQHKDKGKGFDKDQGLNREKDKGRDRDQGLDSGLEKELDSTKTRTRARPLARVVPVWEGEQRSYLLE